MTNDFTGRNGLIKDEALLAFCRPCDRKMTYIPGKAVVVDTFWCGGCGTLIELSNGSPAITVDRVPREEKPREPSTTLN